MCLLHKAIYGLNQVPRAWFDSFTTQLFHLEFHASCVESTFLILIHSAHIVYLLLYVDDIVITGNHPTFVVEIIKQLGNSFALKDLGTFWAFRLSTLLMVFLCISPSMPRTCYLSFIC